MMYKTNKTGGLVTRLFAAFLLLFTLAGVFCATVFAQVPQLQKVPVAQPTTLEKKDVVAQPTVSAKNAVGPSSDGQITGVTVVPAAVWRTGTTVKVQWNWPGYINSPADVILGTGSGAAFSAKTTITINWGSSSAGWEVPFSFAPGNYTLRVRSSANNNNFAETTVRIENSSISLVAPASGQTWIGGTTNQVVWSFQGKPGSLNLDLIPTSGANAQRIASGIAWGASGTGSFNWLIPGNLAVGSYRLRLTSAANSAISCTGPTFTIALPSIALIQPSPGATYQQGSTVPIKWSYKGDIGPTVKVKIRQAVGGGVIPPIEITTPSGASGQGGYDGWTPPPFSSSQQYSIRVESLQNPQIFSEIASPISVPGSSSVHGAAAAPDPASNLVGVDVTFDTTSDNKDYDSCVNIKLIDTAKSEFASRLNSYCGSDNSTEFKKNTSITFPLNNVDTSRTRNYLDQFTMSLTLKANGYDTWKFHVSVALRFQDGSTMQKRAIGEITISAKGANILRAFIDENPSEIPGYLVITDWQ